MEAIQGLLAGVGTGIFITLIPGMLNMQVVATAVRAGRQNAYKFSLGLAIVTAMQATLAVLFADILRQTHILPIIKEWAIPLLIVLAAGFLVKGFYVRKARKMKTEKPYSGGPFWRGLMMSAMNVLNIPFIFALASFQIANGLLSAEFVPRLLFIPGTFLGAISVFLVYARSSDWIRHHAAYFTRNIYFFVGGLLGLLALVQIYRVY